jgi:hypothetical protein
VRVGLNRRTRSLGEISHWPGWRGERVERAMGIEPTSCPRFKGMRHRAKKLAMSVKQALASLFETE